MWACRYGERDRRAGPAGHAIAEQRIWIREHRFSFDERAGLKAYLLLRNDYLDTKYLEFRSLQSEASLI